MKTIKKIITFVLIVGTLMTLALIVPACSSTDCAVKVRNAKKDIRQKQRISYTPYYVRAAKKR